MIKIQKLIDHMYEEIEGIEEYIDDAADMQTEDKDLMKIYLDIVNQEFNHVDTLHTAAVNAINKWKSAGNEAPQAMQAIWDWEHKKIVDKVAHLKNKLATLKK